MNPRWRAAFQVLFLVILLALLFLFFPHASEFVEMAARELRYFWWIILLVALAVWLIWGVRRKPPKE
jgi:hypothetical protein